jgi:hypothetical protein
MPVTEDHRNSTESLAPDKPQLVARSDEFRVKALVGAIWGATYRWFESRRPDHFGANDVARDYCSAARGYTPNGQGREWSRDHRR